MRSMRWSRGRSLRLWRRGRRTLVLWERSRLGRRRWRVRGRGCYGWWALFGGWVVEDAIGLGVFVLWFRAENGFLFLAKCWVIFTYGLTGIDRVICIAYLMGIHPFTLPLLCSSTYSRLIVDHVYGLEMKVCYRHSTTWSRYRKWQLWSKKRYAGPWWFTRSPS